MPHRTPCTESAHDRARRLMPHRTPCTDCAHDRARRMMTHRTPCTDGANARADTRCTPCTSSASSPRARMAPLLEGLCSLPLHPLVQLLWDFHFALGIVDVRNLYPDPRSPNRRRHHSRARRSATRQRSHSFLNRRKTNLLFSLTVNSTETLRLPVMGQGCSLVSIQLSTSGQSDDDFWLNFG